MVNFEVYLRVFFLGCCEYHAVQLIVWNDSFENIHVSSEALNSAHSLTLFLAICTMVHKNVHFIFIFTITLANVDQFFTIVFSDKLQKS